MEFNGVGIKALAGCVPHTIIDNYKYTQYFPEDQVKAVVDKVGVYEHVLSMTKRVRQTFATQQPKN